MFRKRKSEEAVKILEEHDSVLSEEVLKQIEELKSTSLRLDEGWEKRITETTSNIIGLCAGRDAIRQTISNLKVKRPEGRPAEGWNFQISSILLRECWQYTTSDQNKNERLLLVTGTVAPDGTRILSRPLYVDFNKQSSVYVAADINSSHNALVTLSEEYGHLLLGIFHSHISRGAASTCPSSIDRRNMERKRNDGIDCIGGIFSLDGYVRFFSAGDAFSIDVYGKGVDLIETNHNSMVFKIANTGN